MRVRRWNRASGWFAAVLLSLVASHPEFAIAESTCGAPALADLETANRKFEAAHQSGDVAGLDALLADDFVLYHSGGLQSEIETRAAFLKRMSAMPAGLFLSRELKDTDSRLYGTVGLVAGRIVTRTKSQWTRGRLKESTYHYLRVFRADHCQWRIAAWHSGWAAADRRDVQFIDSYLAVYPPESGAAQSAATLGARTFDEACASCHRGAGAFGAPGVDDAAYWRRRSGSMEQLYSNALNGIVASKSVMPAKGGRPDLSDEAVRAAVDYMVSQSRSAGREVSR
jgi:cytochrome c5/ketosteroid isomerase-like protein